MAAGVTSSSRDGLSVATPHISRLMVLFLNPTNHHISLNFHLGHDHDVVPLPLSNLIEPLGSCLMSGANIVVSAYTHAFTASYYL